MSSFDKVQNSLRLICDECNYYHTDKCTEGKCSIGFSKNVIGYAEANSNVVLKDGDKLLPREDFKYYSEELIANSIGEICKLCKQCRENHSEQCVISLCRRSLENTVLKENSYYPGNILMYLMDVSEQNPAFAKMIKAAYEGK